MWERVSGGRERVGERWWEGWEEVGVGGLWSSVLQLVQNTVPPSPTMVDHPVTRIFFSIFNQDIYIYYIYISGYIYTIYIYIYGLKITTSIKLREGWEGIEQGWEQGEKRMEKWGRNAEERDTPFPKHNRTMAIPDCKVHEAYMGPTWGPCRTREPCYQGCYHESPNRLYIYDMHVPINIHIYTIEMYHFKYIIQIEYTFLKLN